MGPLRGCELWQPASAALIASSAIWSGVIGRYGDMVGECTEPVMAHVIIIFLSELIKREKVTFTCGVPIFLRMLIDSPESPQYIEYLRGLKFLLDGEHPPRALIEKAKKMG